LNLLTLLILAGIILLTAYWTYGRLLQRLMRVEPDRETPAHALYDGVDYSPASKPVLLGHHFATIAGGGPIVGPIAAALFGWLPAVIWILLGSVFIGGVHDYSSLQASIRHRARSIGALIKEYVGNRGQILYLCFTLATLTLIVGVFVILVAETFAAVPEAATASVLFVGVALVFGAAVNLFRIGLVWASLLGAAAMVLSVWAGMVFPLSLSATVWSLLLLGYAFVASVLPVWVLLQPRDYLNAFLLYGMMVGASAGILLAAPRLEAPAFTGFYNPQLGFLFPILFITIACGAISGFHSLVSSGTTAKQLSREGHGRFIAYGGMLLEGFLAIIAVGSVAYLTQAQFTSRLAEMGGPIGAFAAGVGFFMSHLGIGESTAVTFTALTASAFLLTTLDSATRLARFSVQELTEDRVRVFANNYLATVVVLAGAAGLALTGTWQMIWPMFGAANQMLGALALLAVTVWLTRMGVRPYFTAIPMVFMLAVTLSALGVLMHRNLFAGNYLMVAIAFLLFVLCVFLAVEGLGSTRVSRRRKDLPVEV
jgi:carbon starvation protein